MAASWSGRRSATALSHSSGSRAGPACRRTSPGPTSSRCSTGSAATSYAPGSGRTTAPTADGDYDLTSIVEFWEAVRRALGLGPVTVMGHSWGGLVAPAWAALHPEGVRRLIVVSGYAGAG